MKKQSKIYLWGFLILMIVLVGAQVVSSSTSVVDSVQDGSLTISETRWELGDVPMSQGINTHSINLTNGTETPITITKMQTSCMCTTAQIVHADGSKSGVKGMVGHGGGTASLSETVAAGEVATLLVRFDPNAHGPSATGPITRDILIETNSEAQPKITLTFSGNVVP